MTIGAMKCSKTTERDEAAEKLIVTANADDR